MNFRIEKNVPIPPAQSGRKYRFEEMEVGDSFFWPGATAGKAATVFSRKGTMKFTVRRVTEGGVDGERVWRTE